MNGFGAKREIDKVAAYRRALLALLERCKDVAEAMSLRLSHNEDERAAFGMQETDDEPTRVTLPTWQVCGGELRVEFTPGEMQQDMASGSHSALVSVERFRDGRRMTCPSIWTSIEATENDIRWYEGARGDTSVPVTEAKIREWFMISGPKPLY